MILNFLIAGGESRMFGFGKTKSSKKTPSKAEQRYVNRKDDEAVRGFFGSAKEESDRRAERGDF